MAENILDIVDLSIQYHTDAGTVKAVNELTLSMEAGESLGLVGETGAGKTTTALGIMRLIPAPPGKVTGGEIHFNGQNIMQLSKTAIRRIRGNKISMIFQDPMTSLNPVMTVGRQISETIRIHDELSRAEATIKGKEMLELVGIPDDRFNEYPHQFSGGMRQRVVIAIALACNPELLIADEPTTALDVTIQAQVLDLLSKLKAERNMSLLLITHDLGVVAEVCDKVAIMYAGELVEYGTLEVIYDRTQHPYTIGLFGSIPDLEDEEERLSPIPGLMADPLDLPVGCNFAPRCERCTEECLLAKPPLIETNPGHLVRCIHIEEVTV